MRYLKIVKINSFEIFLPNALPMLPVFLQSTYKRVGRSVLSCQLTGHSMSHKRHKEEIGQM